MLLRADPKEQTAIVVFKDGTIDVTRRPEHVREPPHGLWWSQPIPPGLRLRWPRGDEAKGMGGSHPRLADQLAAAEAGW